jgi:5'-phosphate synthase pdxT subunit
MRIGVLALQGDFEAHAAALGRLGVEAVAVRTAAALDGVEGLVLPGGESTTMLRLMEVEGLDAAIATRVRSGTPVLATCAGVVLLAREVEPVQPSLGLLDVSVRRNAYGRQVASAVVPVRLAPAVGEPPEMEGVFIRAPRITRTGPGVEVLGWRDDDPVLVREGRILAATYHPELTPDLRVHRLLLGWAGD